jgi:hypothetical protein
MTWSQARPSASRMRYDFSASGNLETAAPSAPFGSSLDSSICVHSLAISSQAMSDVSCSSSLEAPSAQRRHSKRIWAAMLSFLGRSMRPPLLYLALVGGGEEPVAAGGASITPPRANASIAIFQFPFSRFSILNQLPWMGLSLTVTE